MKKIILLCLSSSLLFSIKALSKNQYAFTINQQVDNNDITATITKDTTEDQLDELVSYFEENGVSLNLNRVEYNNENEITSIKILLEKDGKQSNYGLSSNLPISNIELGYKDKSLFIEADSIVDPFNSFAGLMQQFSIDNNSLNELLSSDFLSFSFDSQDLQRFMNNDIQSFDFNALRDRFLNNTGSNYISPQNSNTGIPKYNFINTPGVNKLIIIDGKESDFKTLNKLAKSDKLEEVDNLKASTATSLYGKKAKDGAIIVTTK